jgi:hypothetical protein
MKPKTVRRTFGHSTEERREYCKNHALSGLCADSTIMTLNGERLVSDLAPGDRVVTRDSGVAYVKSIHSRQVTTQAVRILAGSLGHTRPERDVTLPAGQPILVRDWRAKAIFNARQAMVPAHRLIDGEFITDQGQVEMTLYQLTFDAPHILYVDGLELGSDPDAVTNTDQGAQAA